MPTSFVPIQDAEARVRAAYESGDVEGLRASARDLRAGRERLRRSLGNVESDQRGYNPNSGTSGGRRLLEGVGAGMQNVGLRAAELGSKGLDLVTPHPGTSGRTRGLRERIDEQTHLDEQMSGLGRVGKFAGEVIATAPFGGLAGRGVMAATRLPAALRASGAVGGGALRRGLGYAAEGAAQTALTSDMDVGQGAGLAAGLTPLFNRGARLVRALGTGARRQPHADTLLDYGADLTPGQLNPEGMIGRLERTAEYSPLLGQKVKTAREAATADVVPNLTADILARPRVRGIGTERSAERVRGRLGTLYGPANAIAVAKPTRAAVKDFLTTVRASIQNRSPGDPKAVMTALRSKIRRVIRAKDTGEIKGVLSDLKKEARKLKYSKDPSTSSFETARVYEDAANWIDKYYKRAMSPKHRTQVDRADNIVAQYKPIEKAVVAGQKQGRYGPSGQQLMSALEPTMTRSQFARGGGGRTRELAEALVDHEKSRSGGLIERTPILRAALGSAVVFPALISRSHAGRRLMQGNTVPQKLLKQALAQANRTRTGRFIGNAARGTRHGTVIPAYNAAAAEQERTQ